VNKLNKGCPKLAGIGGAGGGFCGGADRFPRTAAGHTRAERNRRQLRSSPFGSGHFALRNHFSCQQQWHSGASIGSTLQQMDSTSGSSYTDCTVKYKRPGLQPEVHPSIDSWVPTPREIIKSRERKSKINTKINM